MNGQFEYVMALVSIVVGLGLTHVLAALGSAVHRLRGHGRPLRLEAVYLSWVAFVLLWMVSFWWWEYKFREAGTVWTFGLYLFVLLYALLLFLLAVILVPRNMQGMDDSFAYFMAGRRWFFAVFLLVNAVDVIDSLLKGREWGLRPAYMAWVGTNVVAGIVGIRARSRRVQRGVAVFLLTYQVVYTWGGLPVLGMW